MSFIMGNKMPIGPAEIQCHQYQRVSAFEQESFLVQTEQVCVVRGDTGLVVHST